MLDEEHVEVRYPQYIAALFATGGAFAMGTILGWPSPSFPILVIEDNNITDYTITATPNQFSWISSSMTLSASLSCIPFGFLINYFGRKKTLLLLLFPLILGWILIILATDLDMLYAGRIFLGVSVGGNCMTIPVYNNEISSPEIRGALGSYFQLMINVGIFFVYSVGYGAKIQIFSLSCLIVAVLITSGLFLMPESPIFLVKEKKYRKAEQALQWLRGDSFNGRAEVERIKANESELENESKDWKEAFRRRATIQGLMIFFGIVVTVQMTGINAIIFYTTEILSKADIGMSPELATVIVGAVQVVATIITSLIVDKVGRRVLMLTSVFVMGIATAMIATYFHLMSNSVNMDDFGWMPVFGLALFVICFSLGIGAVAWIYLGELFASDVRGVAVSIAITLNFFLAFIVSSSFGAVQDTIGIDGTFWLYSGFCVVGFIFILFFVPETKEINMENIQKILSSGKIFMLK